MSLRLMRRGDTAGRDALGKTISTQVASGHRKPRRSVQLRNTEKKGGSCRGKSEEAVIYFG